MSTTATMTMTAAPGAESVTRTLSTAPCCPQCGTDLEGTQPFEEMQAAVLDAHNKIQELQNQVRLLNEKASSAVDRWADYEDEIARLRGQLKQQQQSQSQTSPAASQISSPQQQSQVGHAAAALATPPQSATPSTTATANASPASVIPARSTVGSVSSFLPTGAASRLSAFLTSRKSTPNLKTSTPPAGSIPHMPTHQSTLSQSFTSSSPLQQPFQSSISSSVIEQQRHQKELSDLQTALSTEKAQHSETRSKLAKAEAKLTATSREIEELSVTLFSEANEMVASERRARAKLEERVKTLEKRDEQKKERLEMLEGAVRRMERVREVLKETERLERRKHGGDEGGGSDYEDDEDEDELGGKLVPVVTPRGDGQPRLDLDD